MKTLLILACLVLAFVCPAFGEETDDLEIVVSSGYWVGDECFKDMETAVATLKEMRVKKGVASLLGEIEGYDNCAWSVRSAFERAITNKPHELMKIIQDSLPEQYKPPLRQSFSWTVISDEPVVVDVTNEIKYANLPYPCGGTTRMVDVVKDDWSDHHYTFSCLNRITKAKEKKVEEVDGVDYVDWHDKVRPYSMAVDLAKLHDTDERRCGVINAIIDILKEP